MNLTVPSQVLTNVNLSNYNTFGIEATAPWFVEVKDESTLMSLLADPWVKDQYKIVLGGGSNFLITKNLDALWIQNSILGMRVVEEDAQSVVLAVGAGEVWHDLVMHCIEQGWGGIENLSLIPGRVGAAPIQNIGAYGVELKDVFHSLKAIQLHTLETREFDLEACAFGYRDSVFKGELKGHYIITEVRLRLNKAPHEIETSYGAIEEELEALGYAEPGIREVSEAVIAIRKRKLPDPAEIGNSGSFFKNPEVPLPQFHALKILHPNLPAYIVDADTRKIPAAWLIDQAGWKGHNRGSYGVHDKQALVLVNHGGAKGEDIYALAMEILADVQAKFGIKLEPEVNVI